MKYDEALVLSETDRVKRLEEYHSKHGYIIISANRGEASPEENGRNKNILKKERSRTGLGFRQVKGYYKEFNMKDPDLENSFIVYSRQNSDSKELYDFAIRCCKIFGQDSVLIAEPNKTPQYFSKNGKQVTWANFSKTITGEDALKQKAYTSFKKITHNEEKYKNQNKQSQKEQAFSFQ